MIARITTALLLTTLPAIAHEWYSSGCCGERDCKPIASCDLLSEQKDGSYLYTPTGDRFNKTDVNPSQDKRCHVCVSVYSDGRRLPRCIYILQGT